MDGLHHPLERLTQRHKRRIFWFPRRRSDKVGREHRHWPRNFPSNVVDKAWRNYMYPKDCSMSFVEWVSDTGHQLLTTVFVSRSCLSDVTSHILACLTMFERLTDVFTLLDRRRRRHPTPRELVSTCSQKSEGLRDSEKCDLPRR